ncbi:hypothetical protein JMJ56_16920 [Belnapia sp. T18]|uniref:Uncharacterized protein n=1 Tax=Belnapia arida TaxID=2804533 RepID=A0ABS1U4W2_9PROT|nr:hypothetical protein [Belnapia arida]MBL6079703.1 hypothetical protein [Belnapia arida]
MVADANSTPTPRFLLPPYTPIYLPYGWETVDAALAWLAFGTSLPRSEWDQYLFIGASDRLTRAEVLQWLEQLGAEPGSLDSFLAGAPENGLRPDEVPPSVRDEVRTLAARLGARAAQRGSAADLDRFIRCAARLLKKRHVRMFGADPRWDGYVDADMEALAAAERELLRRGADGSALLFGWPGRPEAEPQAIIAPRQRISPELCAAPVSFDRDLALLPCLRSDARHSAPPLFHGVVISADALLRLRPQAEPAAGDQAPMPQIAVPAGMRRAGGRKPTHHWPPFHREIVRFVFLHGRQTRRSALNRHMKEWVGENMETDPEDRTIEKQVDVLAPSGGAIPD